MTTYVQLLLKEREVLFGALKQGKSLRSIAKKLGRSHTTLARELQKNCKYGRAYLPCTAQKRHDRVTKRQRYHAPLKNPLIYLFVREKLRLHWSPETIVGRLKCETEQTEAISKDTVYSYIYKTKKRRRDFIKFLTRKHTRRRPHTGRSVQNISKIPNAVSIDKRHYLVGTRTTIGHWESDLMEGVRGEPKALSVEAERVTKCVKLTLVLNKTSNQKTQALETALAPLPKRFKKTITVDNGSENHHHTVWNDSLKVKIYFTHPYHSWEKGTVENTIGRVRRYIPKGSSLAAFTQKDIKSIENQMNNTPRKSLGYKTPAEMVREVLQYKTAYKPTWCTSD